MSKRLDAANFRVAGAHANVADYHPHAQALGRDGVRDFFMPAPEASADRLLKRLLADFAQLLNGAGIDNNRTAEAIWLMSIYLALDAVSTFIMLQIATGNEARRLGVAYGGDESALTRLGRGQTFDSAVAVRLQSKDFKPSLIRTWGRFARACLRGDDVSRKPPLLIDRQSDILCFAAEPWHRRLASEQGKCLVLSHPENWFAGFAAKRESSSRNLDQNLIGQVTDICANAIRDEGLRIPDHVRASLNANVAATVQTAAAMRASLEAKRRYLPREFWATSMGPAYNRVLARVVQKEGGSVTAFDHGTGCGWMNMPELVAFEWDFCDRFITFSETHAEAIRNMAAQGGRYKVNARECVVSASRFPLYDVSIAGKGGHPRGGREKLSVWYVPTHYTQEQFYVPPVPPDVVELDFQVRLLCDLADLGHEVVVKPHPGCKVGLPPGLIDCCGARIDKRPFEEIVAEPDVVVFDYPQSTALRSAVIAGIPMVVLDPGRTPFLPDAMSLLQRRAAVVPIERDAENRRHVAKAALSAAVAEAPQRMSDAFQRAYYPVV